MYERESVEYYADTEDVRWIITLKRMKTAVSTLTAVSCSKSRFPNGVLSVIIILYQF